MKIKIKSKLNPIIVAIIGIVVLSLFFSYNSKTQNKKANANAQNGNCVVTFIDVSQGDCSLISCNGEYALIDAGENNMGDLVVSELKRLGVSEIKYAIGTHAHSDHIGGLDTVIKQIKTENIILTDLPDDLIPNTKTYTDLLTAIENENVNLIVAEPDLSFNIGSGILTLLGPVKNYGDLNDMSIVARFDFKNTSFLFTGDAGFEPEKDMIKSGANLSADVIKIGHHGSATSSSSAFLKAVSPDYAVISVGQGNSYGHPKDQSLKRISNVGAEVYRTDLLGNITAVSDGENISF